jgi:hypothetical protein
MNSSSTGPLINEAWEYWVPDPEIAEALAMQDEHVITGRRQAAGQDPFRFFFAGDRTMSSGRFYDGIQVGRQAAPWFFWNIMQPRKQVHIVSVFEAWLASIQRGDREEVLAERFCAAWDRLPGERQQFLCELLAIVPPGGEGRGAPRRPLTILADRQGRHRFTMRNWYLQAKFNFILAALPDEYKRRCACGCGQITRVSHIHNKKLGMVPGVQVEFVSGHEQLPYRVIYRSV